MTVREILTEEHALFTRLLDALEASLKRPDERARADAGYALRILLPALDRHEELEDIVFCGADEGAEGGALRLVRRQHENLGVLREETLDALELADGCPIERLRALSGFLITSLRSHLTTEETLLWPLFDTRLDAREDERQDALVGRRARAIEKHLRRGLAALAEHPR